jgi:translation elongation factor EF-Tu-like GTPase
MGFWSRLTGRTEDDTTVTDYQAAVGRPTDAVARAHPVDAPVDAPTDARPVDAAGPFQLTVEDVFSITGRGTVATGKIASGRLSVGDVVEVQRPSQVTTVQTTVIGIEAFRKKLEFAMPGDLVGVLLSDVTRDDVPRGSVLTHA